MMDGEIDSLAEFDWDCGKYYEVELWVSGDCESRYFKTKSTALKCFSKLAKNQSDCIKYHHSGECEIIKEFGE